MRRCRAGLFGLLVLLSASQPAWSEPLTPQQDVSGDENLRIMSEFFIPEAALRDVISDACEVQLRGLLKDDETLVRMDGDGAKLPGVIDRMVAAGDAYCEQNWPAAAEGVRGKINAAWGSQVTPAENARLAKLYLPYSVAGRKWHAERDPGGRMKLVDSPTPSPAEQRAFATGYAAIAATAAGRELLAKVTAFQDEFDAHMVDFLAPVLEMRKKAGNAAMAAANSYAKERGYQKPYPDEPQ